MVRVVDGAMERLAAAAAVVELFDVGWCLDFLRLGSGNYFGSIVG